MPTATTVKINGVTLLVETDETIIIPSQVVNTDSTARSLPAGAEEVVSIEDLKGYLKDVKQAISTTGAYLYGAVEGIPKPEKFTVEFGIKLAGEAGVPMLTKASGEANFKVSIEWKPV